MGKSIFLLMDGEYEDVHVVGAFSTLDKAELLQAMVDSGTNCPTSQITEYMVDAGVKELMGGSTPWNVILLRNGEAESLKQSDDYESALRQYWPIWERSKIRNSDAPDCLDCTVFAKDAKHAVKIANEIRVRMIANGEWA